MGQQTIKTVEHLEQTLHFFGVMKFEDGGLNPEINSGILATENKRTIGDFY